MTLSSTPITYKSQTLTLKQWAEHCNIPYPTLRERYARGLLPPQLFAGSPKIFALALITHNGQTMQLRHWAKELGIKYSTLRMRYKIGMRPPELLSRRIKSDLDKRTPRYSLSANGTKLHVTKTPKISPAPKATELISSIMQSIAELEAPTNTPTHKAYT
jgi:hypothetical protein